MSIALVTGSLAPYSNRLYEAFAKSHGEELHVLQCAKVEPGRKWTVPKPENIKVTTLKGLTVNKSDISHVYVNPGVIPRLARLRPDTIIIDSFSPTMIAAGLYAAANGMSLGMLIEGARDLDPGEYSFMHARLRRLIAPRATFGICTSYCAREMMESWGLKPGRGVIVRHFGSWDAPPTLRGYQDRPFDLLICGTLNERKNPMFLADLVDRLGADGFKPRVRIVGDGPLRGALTQRLAAAGVEALFDGHQQHDGIIEAYQSAKVMLFPTRADTWGLVANEAMLCGTPVLASPHAISARELVAGYGTGLVRELDVGVWSNAVRAMLASRPVWENFMKRRNEAKSEFGLDCSVSRLATAIEVGRSGRRRAGMQPDPAGVGRQSIRAP